MASRQAFSGSQTKNWSLHLRHGATHTRGRILCPPPDHLPVACKLFTAPLRFAPAGPGCPLPLLPLVPSPPVGNANISPRRHMWPFPLPTAPGLAALKPGLSSVLGPTACECFWDAESGRAMPVPCRHVAGRHAAQTSEKLASSRLPNSTQLCVQVVCVWQPCSAAGGGERVRD